MKTYCRFDDPNSDVYAVYDGSRYRVCAPDQNNVTQGNTFATPEQMRAHLARISTYLRVPDIAFDRLNEDIDAASRKARGTASTFIWNHTWHVSRPAEVHKAAASIPINSKPAPPSGPAPAIPAQRSGGGMPQLGNTKPAPPPTGGAVLGHLPSSHGGKPIPVVRSHAAIAAAKKAMADAAAIGPGDPLTSKSYVLVGKREESGEIKVVKHWPHLPTQQEVEQASKDVKYRYTSFALASMQNVWNP